MANTVSFSVVFSFGGLGGGHVGVSLSLAATSPSPSHACKDMDGYMDTCATPVGQARAASLGSPQAPSSNFQRWTRPDLHPDAERHLGRTYFHLPLNHLFCSQLETQVRNPGFPDSSPTLSSLPAPRYRPVVPKATQQGRHRHPPTLNTNARGPPRTNHTQHSIMAVLDSVANTLASARNQADRLVPPQARRDAYDSVQEFAYRRPLLFVRPCYSSFSFLPDLAPPPPGSSSLVKPC